ncbi:DUF551 domain-containing protein [Citrobacter freundii]|uniref:DUF551 domain-containing protein n=1 Tax=Citrobacter freundii TaxID=546 RepID=UPI003F9E074E
MELQPITPDSLDDEALTDLIEIRKSGVDHHASEGNKVQHAIQSLTLIALVELQQRRDADSSDPIYQWRERYEEGSLWDDCTKAQYDGFAKKTDCEVRILYTAPPAPVSVPAAMEMDDDFDSAFEHGKAVGWNACRAAMLQGAEQQQNQQQNIPENIPGTLFKPVADLYGLTSPTGGETSFTFDAVEARDFIDGGWSCQEYVELERFQEAVSGNSPVIPDGWVACSERMPETMVSVLVTGTWFHHAVAFWDGLSWCDLDFEPPVTHWMPLPAAPQQEA